MKSKISKLCTLPALSMIRGEGAIPLFMEFLKSLDPQWLATLQHDQQLQEYIYARIKFEQILDKEIAHGGCLWRLCYFDQPWALLRDPGTEYLQSIVVDREIFTVFFSRASQPFLLPKKTDQNQTDETFCFLDFGALLILDNNGFKTVEEKRIAVFWDETQTIVFSHIAARDQPQWLVYSEQDRLIVQFEDVVEANVKFDEWIDRCILHFQTTDQQQLGFSAGTTNIYLRKLVDQGWGRWVGVQMIGEEPKVVSHGNRAVLWFIQTASSSVGAELKTIAPTLLSR